MKMFLLHTRLQQQLPCCNDSKDPGREGSVTVPRQPATRGSRLHPPVSAAAESAGPRVEWSDGVSLTYAWYTVGVLTLLYTFSFVDRQILTLLFAPIKHDLGITDTEVSLLSGIAFAGLYALLGIPIARLTDRGNRVAIITAGMLLWSTMTSLCGLARNFWQLFLARVGVGIGEATLSPAAYSIIADYFPPSRLGRALSVYTLAIYFGMGAALLLGSFVIAFVQHVPPLELPLVGTVRPWQLALVCVGMPGVLFALLMLTVREPRRRGSAVPVAGEVRSVFRHLRTHWRVYVPHFAGFSLMGLLGNGLVVWIPEFFRRQHGWPTDRTGVAFGVILLSVGGPGVLLGGWIADRLRASGDLVAPIRVAIAAIVPLGLCGVVLPLVASPWSALALLAAIIFCFSVPGGLAPASVQMVTPPALRARVSAVYLFCTSLIGGGLGPTVVAAVTDYVFRDEAALGRSLSVVAAVVTPISVVALVSLVRPFRSTIESMGG
jgi:MFS family permease